MCGIAGQFNFSRQEPVRPEVIRHMTRTMVHRGPDDEGYFISGPLGFGFRRLSIIDLAGGHQPMSDVEETVWVIFNGEIYNYLELRRELEALGHRFRTRSDTEVIVHGYREWGDDVFNHLNGMFGVAIWDALRRRLLIARDAMGIKLIYYRVAGGQLSFGSEIRPVLAAGEDVPDVDPIAINLFLRFRYTPSPLTIYKGVRKLAPGTMLVVENGECQVKRWYNYTPTPFEKPRDDVEARQELLELYRAAVKRHLLSDVPVGILLSGGLDSGLLLALMKEEGGPWPSYTVGYGNSFADDELKDAAETASLMGGRHVPVLLDQAEFERSLPHIVDCLEEPVATSSIVPMYFVSLRARQDVKVALIGQGPDELFGGYKRHLGVHYGNYWRGMPKGLRSLVGSAVGYLPRNETLKRGVHSLGIENRLERYQHVFSLIPGPTLASLFREDEIVKAAEDELINCWHELVPQMEYTDELGSFQVLEIRSSLPDELLMYADKLSMAHSLEVRVPYLDKTVVEFAQRLGAGFKIRNRNGKWLHRRVCESYLPPAILNRKKRGFAVNVVDDWFQSSAQGHLLEMLEDSESLMFEILEPEPVQELLREHQSGAEDNHKVLFSLVMLEQWLRGVGAEPLSAVCPVGN
jgi:asparagine synthase (glutamine-hydrolysing)